MCTWQKTQPSRNVRLSDQPTGRTESKSPIFQHMKPRLHSRPPPRKPFAMHPQLSNRVTKSWWLWLEDLYKHWRVRKKEMPQHSREPANTAGKVMAQWVKTLTGKREDWSSRPRTRTKHFNPALRRQRWESPSELASICELLFQWETASVNRVMTKEDTTYQLLASTYTSMWTHVYSLYTLHGQTCIHIRVQKIKRLGKITRIK